MAPVSFLLVATLSLVQMGCSASRGMHVAERSIEDTADGQVLGTQYHLRLGTEDELQFDVYVWGQVNKPGLYAIADGTDLISLISLAGGPTDDAKLTRVTVVPGRGEARAPITIDLEEFLESGKRQDIPLLRPGDTVVVPAKLTHSLFRFTGVLSVAALIANVIVTAATR
jgi:hypothetical protein